MFCPYHMTCILSGSDWCPRSFTVATMSSSWPTLYGEPFISIRESIAWPPSTPAFEDSDVLVLSSRPTSPGVGSTLLYLDLRLSLPLSKTSTINWGLAGLRHTLSIAPDPVRHRWDHATIDSRDDGYMDEGKIIRRDGREIETGIGFNPTTGQKEAYEEIWRDEPLPEGSPYIFVTSSPIAEIATATMAVLGPHALALSQDQEMPGGAKRFHAVRMEQRPTSAQDTETTWNIIFSTGYAEQEKELSDLLELVGQGHKCARGSEVNLGSRTWTVWDAGRQGTGDE
ncbi:hypothetical protein BS17DRAFT_238866 [Gyrodon lividus]|nr:hypothetical protein BS17DRAFT_238866 [Gyrodon lividus]